MQLRLIALLGIVLAFVAGCGQGGNWTDSYTYHFQGTELSGVSGLPDGEANLAALEKWTQYRYYKTGLMQGIGHNANDHTDIRESVMVSSNLSSPTEGDWPVIQPFLSGTLKVEDQLGIFELTSQGGTGEFVINTMTGEFNVGEAQKALDEIAGVTQHSFQSTSQFTIHWVAQGHLRGEFFETEFDQLVHAVGEFSDSYRDNGNLVPMF